MSSVSRFRVQESRRIPSANIFALVIEHTVIVCHYENEIQLVVEEIKDCEGITEPVYFVDTQSVNPPPTTAEANAPEDYENNDAAEDLTDKSDSETDVISKPITDKGQTLTSGITHDTTDRLACAKCLRSFTLTTDEVLEALRKLERRRTSSSLERHSKKAR